MTICDFSLPGEWHSLFFYFLKKKYFYLDKALQFEQTAKYSPMIPSRALEDQKVTLAYLGFRD